MSAAPVVELSNADVLAIGVYGLERTANAIAAGRKLEAGRADLGFGRGVEGVLGEAAFAKWLGVFYAPEVRRPDTVQGDVHGFQVRSTCNQTGSLIVKKRDPEGAYVLALLSARKGGGITVKLAGWLDGTTAKDARWWQERDSARRIHQAAFFVPQSALRPIDTLPVMADSFSDEREAA